MKDQVQFVFDNWHKFVAFGAIALSAGVHVYQVVTNAGGIKNLWSKFMNGVPANVPPSAVSQPTTTTTPKN